VPVDPSRPGVIVARYRWRDDPDVRSGGRLCVGGRRMAGDRSEPAAAGEVLRRVADEIRWPAAS
jgi:hypothetical protein